MPDLMSRWRIYRSNLKRFIFHRRGAEIAEDAQRAFDSLSPRVLCDLCVSAVAICGGLSARGLETRVAGIFRLRPLTLDAITEFIHAVLAYDAIADPTLGHYMLRIAVVFLVAGGTYK